MSKINILLLNWNSSTDINLAIGNLLRSSYLNIRVILIDNKSADEDQLGLLNVFNKYQEKIEMHMVFNSENYGYAGGNNRGLDYLIKNNLEGDILILNPDIRIQPNTIEEMRKALYDDVAGVMVKTLQSREKKMYDYITINGLFQEWNFTNADVVSTDYLAGSCMLLKRDVIEQIGLFDEDFFMYWEEVDLSFRIQDLGFQLVSTTRSYIERKDNPAIRNDNAIYFLIRNSFFIQNKFPERISNLQLIMYVAKSSLAQISYSLRNKNYIRVFKWFEGVKDGLQYKKMNNG